MMEQTSKPRVHLGDFAAIVGPDYAFEQNGKLSLAPANTAEIAAVLRLANAEGVIVHPVGGDTKAGWSDAPRSGIILRTARLNAVLDHTWQDMTCSVQAGCTWAAMQLTLAAHGQFVALDPLWPERATIGGVAATNDSGALRLKYGSLRDLIIGMTIVLADGTIAKTGGKVVKNVAGYDLHKLMIGAFGTLGFITEVNFRLHSLPTARESFTVCSANVGALGELMLHLVDSHLSLHALQLRASEGTFHLDIELASLPQTLDEHRLMLETIAHEKQLRIVAAAVDIWQGRALLFDREDSFTIRATMLPGITSISWVGATPVDEKLTHYRVSFFALVAPDCPLTDEQIDQYDKAATPINMAEQYSDGKIWPHKAYVHRPMLSAVDGPILKYREWYRQFDPRPVAE